jgi:hypothetical protein
MVVSINSFSYSLNLIRNYTELSSQPKKLLFKIYCLDKYVYRRYVKRNNVNSIFLVDFKTQKGSVGHALGLAKCLENLEVGSINILSDVDVFIVRKNWDDVLKQQVLLQTPTISNLKSIGILGTTYENFSGFSSGTSTTQNYKNKPTLTWCALSPDYDFKFMKVMPDKANVLLIDDDNLSEIYELPIGFSLLKDVGWQLPLYLHENSIPYKVFEHIKPTDDKSIVLRDAYPYHDEFHLNGSPFLVHQRGSMKHVYRLDKISRNFYSKVDNYLNKPAWLMKPKFHDYFNFLYKKIRNIIVKAKNYK